MSKKHKTTDEERERAEDGQLPKPEGEVLENGEPKAPDSNREAVQGFILTRGGFLSAHDTEAIDTMLTAMGINPEAAPAPTKAKEEPAEEVAPVGDGEPVVISNQ